MTECCGRCNEEWRRAEALGEPHDLLPVAGEPVWCQRCRDNVLTVLHDLPELWSQLDADKGRRASADSGERVSKSESFASPSPEFDEQDELVRFLYDWEDCTRERMRYSDGGRARRVDLAHALAFHHAHATLILEDPDLGEDYGRELLSERARLRSRTKTGSGFQAKSMPCPRCQQRRLVHELGTDYITCQNQACGRMLTHSEYDEIARAVAA